jgi:hypothetical protein
VNSPSLRDCMRLARALMVLMQQRCGASSSGQRLASLSRHQAGAMGRQLMWGVEGGVAAL